MFIDTEGVGLHSFSAAVRLLGGLHMDTQIGTC